MESPDAKPEEKEEFRYPNLRRHVIEHRGKILLALLTVLKGWHAAGRPAHKLKAWGSFEGWSGVVREAMRFAGWEDPGDTRMALQAVADRDTANMEVIVAHLNDLDLSAEKRGVTAGDVVEKLKDSTFLTAAQAELKAAIEELCGKLDARPLGYKFRHFARRNFNGLMLDRAGEDRLKGNRWKVYTASEISHGRRASPPSPAGSETGSPAAGDAGDGSGREKDHPPETSPPTAGDAGDGRGPRKNHTSPTGGKQRWGSDPNRGTPLSKEVSE